MDRLMTFKELFEVILLFEEQYKLSDVKCVRSYFKFFLTEGSYENPQENQVGGICVRRLSVCHEHKVSATTYFSLRKIMARQS
jgi:hypothetical protein